MRRVLLGIAVVLAATLFAPLSAAESKVVTVTLVRWPYT